MSDTDEIKSRMNIVEYIGKRVTLKKTGRNYKGLCPFHNEKTPSFIVSPERESWHCFGCGKGGDIFTFVMEFEHVDFPEALETLAEITGVKLTRRVGDTPEAKLKQKIFEVNHLALEYYQYILTKHTLGDKARRYLKERGVTDKSIKTFGLGYSPNSWDGLLSFLKKKQYDVGLLEKAGLVTRRHNDMFRGRVMFALRDHRGNVVGFAGRVLDPTIKESKYINTPETPVYIKSNVLYGLDVTRGEIQKANDAVVMEGELDVISSFQEGISNVVAIKGSALTEGHVRLLSRFTERIAFALDSDLAGDAAARRGIEIADRAGLDIRVVTISSGKDPDEAVRENPALFKKAIKDAVPIYDYFIDSATRRFDVASAFGKKKVSDELLPVFAKIENPIVRGHYMKKLASSLDTSEERLEDAIKRIEKNTPFAKKAEEAPSDTPKTRGNKMELYVLALLLQGKTKELYKDFQERVAHAELTHPAVKKILTYLEVFLKKDAPFIIKEFADGLAPELLPALDEAFMWDIGEIVSQDDLLKREWHQALRELDRAIIKRKIHELTGDMKKDASNPDTDAKLQALTDRLKVLEKEG